MNVFRLFSLLLVSLLTLQVSAQDRGCGAMEHLEYEISQDPARALQVEAMERHTEEWIANGVESRQVITIPIVFHVLYNTAEENISDARIMSQLQVLNDDFRRTNSDADNTWSQAADTEIQFCLATVDPNGNATTGITRTYTNTTSFGTNDAMKYSSSGGKDAWPAGDYLNMWICDIGSSLLGYAQFPGGNPDTDGVVNHFRYTGVSSGGAPYGLGRTATHEVGHWLNLRHIWGDGRCNRDDFVSDTPKSDASNGGCNVGHVSCQSVDMVQNYMDYSYDACMNLFTAGQAARMQALFGSGGARESILSSNGCGTGGTGPTCTDGIQNGDETGVDCGGSVCDPCDTSGPTCTDGIQNGDETGVDCGGSVCDPCAPGNTCQAPTGTYVEYFNNTSRVRIHWDAMTGADRYGVRYRAEGSSSWTTKTTGKTDLRITGISSGVTYEYQLSSRCSGVYTDYSASYTFATGGGRLASPEQALDVIEITQLFPNPAQEVLNLSYEVAIDGVVNIQIYDVLGRKVYEEVMTQTAGENQLRLDVANLKTGYHLLRIQKGSEQVMAKFVKQ